jgi:hypothetical protein
MDTNTQRKIRAYERRIDYIKAYNKEHREAQNERCKKHFAKIKDTDKFKQYRKDYYRNVLKPRRQEQARMEKE